MDGIYTGWMQTVWAQCWQVTLLILGVWLTVRLVARNRPHLACVLWLVVLVKCVTPPLLSSPSSIFSWMQAHYHGAEVSTPNHAWELSRRAADNSLQTEAQEVVVHVSRTNPHPTDQFPIDPRADSPSRFTGWFSGRNSSSWVGIFVGIWSVGCVAFASLAGLRWARCWQRLRRAGELKAPEVVRMVDQLRQRIGLLRPVRLMVSRSPVGPAVVGIFRPTIILPALIVESKTLAELEPLLAHELIHIKRGDLWVGLLQLLAQGLWWFHPLVRVANTLLTREAERCCDEEVIAHLGCDPGRYARSLIDVLALKRTLQPVPAFPGVRPVDVTSQRLERIMKLGQGCHKRTPKWCWLVMLLAVSATLPGAAFIVASDEPVPEPARDWPLSAQPAPKLLVTAAPEKEDELLGNSGFETRVYHVQDLVELLQKQSRIDDAKARSMLIDLVQQAARPSAPAAKAVIAQKDQTPTWDSLTSQRPTITWADKSLMIKYSKEGHERIVSRLQAIRKDGFSQFEIEIRIITGKAARLDSIPVNWKILDGGASDEDLEEWNGEEDRNNQAQGKPASPIRGRVESVVETHHPMRMAIAESQQVRSIVDKAQADRRTNIMSAPKITLFNGQSASIVDQTQRPFVVGEQRTEKGSAPVVRWLKEGWSMRMRPQDVNGDLFHLDLKMSLTGIRDVKTATVPSVENQSNITIQIPELVSTKISTHVEMTSTQTLVIDDLSRLFKTPDKQREPFAVLVTVRKVQLGSRESPDKQIAQEVIPNPIQTVAGSQPASESKTLPPPVHKAEMPLGKKDKYGPDLEGNPDVLETRVYNVADLVIPLDDAPVVFSEDGSDIVGSSRAPQGNPDFESLIELITSTIGPDCWDERGGQGSIKSFEATLSLVIRQTADVHQEIVELLRQLRYLQDLQASFHLERVEISTAEFEAWAEKQSEPLAAEIVGMLRSMPGPAISINRQVAELIRQAEGVKVQSGPKVTLFNAQRIELPLSKSSANSATDVAWLQLNPVISSDLRMVRVNVAAGISTDEKQNPRNNEFVTMPRGQSLLIDLSQQSWMNRNVGVPILNKIPHVNRLFKNDSSVPSSASRQFYLITPRIILVHDEAESGKAVLDKN